MPTPLSGPRRARSFVTPAGGNIVSRVLDFNFASDQGIEITAVLGNVMSHDASPAVSDTVPAELHVVQTLHLEEGTIEVVRFADGDDEDQIDTEIFFQQHASGMFQVPSTAGGGGGSGASSTLYVPFIEPILVARNITHSARDNTSGQTSKGSVLIYYRYVKFSIQELGLILARRQ